jgi:Ni/Co efflux regulator RcnB
MLLLAASVAAPLQAEPNDDNGFRRGGGGEHRAEPAREAQPARPEVRPQFNRPAGGPPPQVQRSAPPAQMRVEAAPQGQVRPQFQRNEGPRGGADNRGDPDRGFHQRAAEWQARQRAGDNRPFDGPRDDNRRNWADHNNGDRRDGVRDNDRRDWNRGQNQNQNQNWNQNQNQNWNRSGGDHRDWRDRGDRRNWDNNWRRDRRYDWQGWRDSHRQLFRGPRYYAPHGYSYRRWGPGYRLDSFLWGRQFWISDPWAYRLPPVEWPYEWVRYFNDVVLVDTTSGEVVDVIYDFFW